MNKPVEIIIVHETVLQSWASDAGTLVTFVALVSIGIFADSAALQWLGALVAFITILGRRSRLIQRLDIASARRRLDEIEARTRT